MNSFAFSILFIVFLLLTALVRFWLGSRQIRHILAHRDAVPQQFSGKISPSAHQKAADYSIAKTKLSLSILIVNMATLVGFTLLGGLQYLSDMLLGLLGPGIVEQIALLAAFGSVSWIIDLPFDYYKHFVLEEKFGFNKMTLYLFVTDMLKSLLLGIVIGLPLLWSVLALMEKAGNLWWLYAWLLWSSFQLLMLVLYPTLIAPLFNKFTPLTDNSLRARIENLMQRVGFASQGLYVMDSSKRSSHGNAYFSGFGRAKRIVFFDTLLSQLEPQEIEAVLAHELGHFKLKHIVKRITVTFLVSLLFLAILGYLKEQTWFYMGLGVVPMLAESNDAMALILFALTLPVFTFPFSPLISFSSRKHEFEADAFASKHAHAEDLASALVKLYKDNASTLTPDPLYSAFYASHPPASERIERLLPTR